MLESHEIENFPSPPLQSEGAPSRYAAQASARALVEQIKDASHQHKQDTQQHPPPPALQQRHFKMRFLWRQVSLELNLFTIIFKLMRCDARAKSFTQVKAEMVPCC